MREVYEIPAGVCADGDGHYSATPRCPHFSNVIGCYCRIDGRKLTPDKGARRRKDGRCPFGSGPIRMVLTSGDDTPEGETP